ncbi:MAG: ABC transporter ATP-binding protein [Solobacterium sp.]|jgi:putative ABC transport system ATP-binding protein|nr:ABC transporter ATP-binding protein [Solobacterium sp.]MCH4206532.1 ABC transporter ATP-binding protein [Solobacterium sp.]MCH4227990.1 ABC transporter ATP-binding protein [Solobacterium sp.]MCH4283409.1 ABC transporter ATP-binding protein [Solobacterium sp.]
MSDHIVLEAKNLKKIYNYHTLNAFEALHSINFQVMDGDFVAIMGPSGSGKSTFINTISTIDVPTEGRVYINGKDVRTMSENDIGRFRYQNLGFIFQDFNLLDTHTMFENIAMPLSLAHVDRQEIAERVQKLAEEMDIAELMNKFPYECSGGQRQRVAICRALINHPHLIMADEPTGNLDSANSAELMNILKNLNESGVTIVMVTHDPLISSYSSRMIYIKDGNIEKDLARGEMSQDEYFQKIVEMNSAESREILHK